MPDLDLARVRAQDPLAELERQERAKPDTLADLVSGVTQLNTREMQTPTSGTSPSTRQQAGSP
eukprot:5859742-Lingulodinium_polyedra.AAC.1